MLYEVKIPGTMPTLIDHARARTGHRGYELVANAQDRVKQCLKAAPSFPGHVYIGFLWVRPNSSVTADDVVYGRRCIINALKAAGVVKEDKVCFYTDLGFKVNAQKPRTMVYIADSEDELILIAQAFGVANA